MMGVMEITLLTIRVAGVATRARVRALVAASGEWTLFPNVLVLFTRA
jgi:hypothetical protein